MIDSIGRGVATQLTELETVGRTLARRIADVLVQFDRPRTSKGPTEAINGGLERPWVLQRHQLRRPSATRHRQHQATNTPLYCGGRLKSPENLRRTSRTRTIARGEVDGRSGRVVPRV